MTKVPQPRKRLFPEPTAEAPALWLNLLMLLWIVIRLLCTFMIGMVIGFVAAGRVGGSGRSGGAARRTGMYDGG